MVRYVHEDCLTVCQSASSCRLRDPLGLAVGWGGSRWGFMLIPFILLSFTRQVGCPVVGRRGSWGTYDEVQHAVGPVAMEEDLVWLLGRNIRGRGSHHLEDQQTPIDPDGQSSPARITVSKETRHVGIEVTETSAMARNWAAGGVSGEPTSQHHHHQLHISNAKCRPRPPNIHLLQVQILLSVCQDRDKSHPPPPPPPPGPQVPETPNQQAPSQLSFPSLSPPFTRPNSNTIHHRHNVSAYLVLSRISQPRPQRPRRSVCGQNIRQTDNRETSAAAFVFSSPRPGLGHRVQVSRLYVCGPACLHPSRPSVRWARRGDRL